MDIIFEPDYSAGNRQDPYHEKKIRDCKKIIKFISNSPGSIFYEITERGIFLYYMSSKYEKPTFLTYIIYRESDKKSKKESDKKSVAINYMAAAYEKDCINYIDKNYPLILYKKEDYIIYNNSISKLNISLSDDKLASSGIKHKETLFPNMGNTCGFSTVLQFIRYDDKFISWVLNQPLYRLDPYIISTLLLYSIVGDTIVNNIKQLEYYLERTEPSVFNDIFRRETYDKEQWKKDMTNIYNLYDYEQKEEYEVHSSLNGMVIEKIDSYEKNDYVFSYIYIYLYLKIYFILSSFSAETEYSLTADNVLILFLSCSPITVEYYSNLREPSGYINNMIDRADIVYYNIDGSIFNPYLQNIIYDEKSIFINNDDFLIKRGEDPNACMINAPLKSLQINKKNYYLVGFICMQNLNDPHYCYYKPTNIDYDYKKYEDLMDGNLKVSDTSFKECKFYIALYHKK
jgi:hypothetical protein